MIHITVPIPQKFIYKIDYKIIFPQQLEIKCDIFNEKNRYDKINDQSC